MKGRDTISLLARRFPQLYVAPAEGAQEAHRMASGRGVAPENAQLDHFITSDEDELREIETLAGPVEVIYLKERADFETFLQIIGNKSQPVPIAPTVGAVTYRGLADWGKVVAAHTRYVESGGEDWPAEFSRLAKTPDAFRSEIIVISNGPYSNVSADDTEYSAADWEAVSREIRLHHECAHVVCRRTMLEDILPVWDEITADVTGLLCATGRYDARLAAKFLAVCDGGFVGGRLTEYLDDEQAERIDEIAREVYAALVRIEELAGQKDGEDPFEFLLELKRKPLIEY